MADQDLVFGHPLKVDWGESLFISDGLIGASVYPLENEPNSLRWELGRTDVAMEHPDTSDYHLRKMRFLIKKPTLQTYLLLVVILNLTQQSLRAQDAYYPNLINKSRYNNRNINHKDGKKLQDLKQSVGFFNTNNGLIAPKCICNLVNNTLQDGTPYVLTNAHCLFGKSLGQDYSGFLTFDYEMSDATDRGDPVNDHDISGIWSAKYEILEMDPITDIALLKLKTYPSELLENNLRNQDANLKDQIEFSIYLLQNLDSLYVNSIHEVKTAILGSTFTEKVKIRKLKSRTIGNQYEIGLFGALIAVFGGEKERARYVFDISPKGAPPLGLEPRTL